MFKQMLQGLHFHENLLVFGTDALRRNHGNVQGATTHCVHVELCRLDQHLYHRATAKFCIIYS